jgi:hypothetical protein
MIIVIATRATRRVMIMARILGTFRFCKRVKSGLSKMATMAAIASGIRMSFKMERQKKNMISPRRITGALTKKGYSLDCITGYQDFEKLEIASR